MINVKLDPKFDRYPRSGSSSAGSISTSNKSRYSAFSKNISQSPATYLSGRRKGYETQGSTRKQSYFVNGTSHIIDASVRKTVVHSSHPLAVLELKPNDIDILRPIVYGSHYNLLKDPNPFYAPWNPPKLRRAEDEGAKTPEKLSSDTTSSFIGKFKDAIENPKAQPKICSMFDCSNIRFTFDKIHNPNDIGSVPIPDLQDMADGSESNHDSVSVISGKTGKKGTPSGRPLLHQLEMVYKPFRKTKFLDSPHLMPFFVLHGKPIICAPLSFLGNTFMITKKLLAPNADNPIYKKLGIHRYEVNMEGFRDEQITFEICEKRVSVTGRKPPSQRNSMTNREVVEIFHLASFLNMNRMRIYRTKNGRIIFEEKWKDEESSDEESNPMRRKIKKKNY